MGIFDIFRFKEFKTENEKLNLIINKMGAGDAITVSNEIAKLKQEQELLLKKINSNKNSLTELNIEIGKKKSEIVSLNENLMYEGFGLYEPHFNFSKSYEYKMRLDLLREKEKILIKNKEAIYVGFSWDKKTHILNKSAISKMQKDLSKLTLRAFNNECDYYVDNVQFNNILKFEELIEKSFESINKLSATTDIEISIEYKKLKIEELQLSHEYQLKKQEEKEEEKRHKAYLREQQKLEQELMEARERIIKEKKHLAIAIRELETKLKTTTDEKEKAFIQKDIEKYKDLRIEKDEEEQLIDYREKNAKAGYVYVISNIGAFGENIYKIGMTRRLDPQDRVDELGDASVPFEFDIHAMVFSDDAPALENSLHQYFYKNRLNKLNKRKEFFRADINEIEKVMKDKYKKVLDIVKIPPAEQYRESLLIKE
jgi:hypothetical protein